MGILTTMHSLFKKKTQDLTYDVISQEHNKLANLDKIEGITETVVGGGLIAKGVSKLSTFGVRDGIANITGGLLVGVHGIKNLKDASKHENLSNKYSKADATTKKMLVEIEYNSGDFLVLDTVEQQELPSRTELFGKNVQIVSNPYAVRPVVKYDSLKDSYIATGQHKEETSFEKKYLVQEKNNNMGQQLEPISLDQVILNAKVQKYMKEYAAEINAQINAQYNDVSNIKSTGFVYNAYYKTKEAIENEITEAIIVKIHNELEEANTILYSCVDADDSTCSGSDSGMLDSFIEI